MPQESSSQPKRDSSPFPKRQGSPHLLFLTVVGIMILLFAVLLVYILLNEAKQKSNSPQAALHPLITTTEVPRSEITPQTKVASTLEVPLYSLLQWKDITKIATSSGLLSATGETYTPTGGQVTIPFPVSKVFEVTKTSVAIQDMMLVDTYYADRFKNSGWVSPGSNSFLMFHSFRLTAPVADGPCGSVSGYLGYKDGLVVLTTINRIVSPCISIGSSIPGSVKRTETYMLSVSQPVPVQLITNYIKSNRKG